MPKIEYKLFRTKSKFSNLLSSLNPQQTSSQAKPSSSYYILVEFKNDLNSCNESNINVNSDDAGIDSIWFNRNNGEVSFQKTRNLSDFDELGKVYGYIGKFQINSSCTPKLLFIKKCEEIGKLRVKSVEHSVYKLKEILVLSLKSNSQAQDDTESLLFTADDLNQNDTNSNSSFTKSPSNTNLMNLADNIQNSLSNLSSFLTSSSTQNQTENPTSLKPISSNSFFSNSNEANTSTTPSPPPPPSTNNNNANKFEKKILEEIIKIFQENNGSFYFSYTYDLTSSVERQQEQFESNCVLVNTNSSNENKKINWKLADDRFFWNKVLLNDLIDLNNNSNSSFKNMDNLEFYDTVSNTSANELSESEIDRIKDKFIIPLIQGYIKIVSLENKLPAFGSIQVESTESDKVELKLSLISRRNRHRLGTRFKRRGIDDNGNVANFVETEQIIDVYDGHTLSFVIIRGSIPIYWSQSGMKYRPPPRIDRTFEENKTAFQKHFDQLEKFYSNQSQIVLVNLVEEYGKESLLGDGYVEQLAEINRNNLTYVQFDFHEHCKGLKFENVSLLRDKVKDMISEQFYCWVDNKGFIFKQNTLFRVNCVDCLDRTNVVQMVLAKYALENQLSRLGFLVPPAELPFDFKKKFSLIWADNGDAISQQYAGTGALKGDFTRTGERNFAGIMKDGMKSANRFYLRFKDNFRQLAVDVLQGVEVQDPEIKQQATPTNDDSFNNLKSSVQSFLSPQKQDANNTGVDDIPSQTEREENVRQLVADCRKLLVDDNEDCYGSWALINYNDSSDLNQVDPDVFLLFTSSALYISNYDDSSETFIDYQKINLKDVEKLEIGPEPVSTIFFKQNAPRFSIMRIYYKITETVIHSSSSSSNLNESANNETSSYFHSFRASNLKFFNNLVITAKTNEELAEVLRGICHTIQSTASFFGCNIILEESNKLLKKKSKNPPNFVRLSRLSSKLSIDDSPTKILSQQQFNVKLNKLGKMIGSKLFGKKPTPTEDLHELSSKKSENMPIPMPTSLGPSASTKFFLANNSPKHENQDLISLSSSPSFNKIRSDSDLINFDSSSIQLNPNETSSMNSKEVDSNDLILDTDAPKTVGKSASNDLAVSAKPQANYVPKLGQKQYTSRQHKLNDINKFIIKESKTKFLFI